MNQFKKIQCAVTYRYIKKQSLQTGVSSEKIAVFPKLPPKK